MNFLELFKHDGLIAAHRGARSICPENTLSALKASIGHCDFIEIDVQLSCDGVAVIMHDETLERTTNVSQLDAYANRVPYRVADFTLQELTTLDYGSWFSTHEPLLTLHEALLFIKEKHLFINIEIKDIHDDFSDESIVSTVLQEIENLHVKHLVLISSFRHEYLKLSKQKLPDLPTAALVEDEHPANLIAYLNNLHVDSYHLDDELVTKQTIKELRQAGFFVNVYTVNDPDRRQELFKMGVNGVFTDVLP